MSREGWGVKGVGWGRQFQLFWLSYLGFHIWWELGLLCGHLISPESF